MLEHLPAVVRRYFELDPYRDAELFVTLFSDDAVVVDEKETRQGTAGIREWRTGAAIKSIGCCRAR